MQNLDHAPLRYLIVSEQFHNNFLFMIDIFLHTWQNQFSYLLSILNEEN